MKPCPYCAELIQDQAAKCRYCSEWLDPSKRPAWSQEAKAAAIATAPPSMPVGVADDRRIDDDDPPHEGPGSTLPVGSGVPELGRREPEPQRTWSAPAWLANAQAARGESHEELAPTDRSTLEEVALRMERIRQSAAAVRESVEPAPRAVRPAAAVPERATLEVEPGVTLPAGSLRALGIEPREPSPARAVRGREPARAVAQAARPAPVMAPEEDDLTDFEDVPAPRPRPRPRVERDEVLLRSERPTVPDIPREQLLPEARQVEDAPRRSRSGASPGPSLRTERPSKRIIVDDHHEPELAAAPTERVRKRSAPALPPEPELPGPPTERVRVRGKAPAAEADHREPPPRKAPAPVPAPVVLEDDLLDDEEADDEMPPPRAGASFDEMPRPRAGAAAFDDDFLDDEDPEEGDEAESGFEDFGGAGPAPRPLPWKPILVAAGVIVVAGVLLFRDSLFPGDPETDEVAAEGAEGEEAAPETKDEPKPKPEPAPKPEGEGQPVQPEAKADAGAGTVVADAGQPAQPAQPVQPAAPDPATTTSLEEARKAYDAANGNARKLQPVGEKLREILTKAPDNPDALTLMAQVYLEQGKMDDSLKTSNRCTEVAPSSAACWLTIGVIQETKGANEIAKLAYQKYLDLASDGRYANDARKALSRLK